MRLVSTLFLCLLGSSAFAEQCDRWTAKMEEDEGGPRMMAWVCTNAPEAQQHHLFFQCGTKDSLWIRYTPFTDESYPPGGNEEYKSKMKFSLDQEAFTLDAHYESMDGAMVMETEVKSAFVSVLTSQKHVTISDVNDAKLPAVTFSLKGSKKAFEKLIATCGE